MGFMANVSAAPQLDFAAAGDLPGHLNIYASESAQAADFNGDARPDVIANTSSFIHRAALLQQDMDGEFKGRALDPEPEFCSIARVADYNGEGLDDFAVEMFDFGRPSDGIWIYFGEPGEGPVSGVRIGAPTPSLYFFDSSRHWTSTEIGTST